MSTEVYFYRYASPLGGITLAGDGEALTGLWFEGGKYCGADFAAWWEEKELPLFQTTVHWLDEYFCGKEPAFVPPLRLEGTSFQKAVWQLLLAVPYGSTCTYGDLAVQLARQRGLTRMAAQAVGGAVGRNPIALIVPCHRVIGADGSLTGYAGGLEKKRYLLELERKGRRSHR